MRSVTEVLLLALCLAASGCGSKCIPAPQLIDQRIAPNLFRATAPLILVVKVISSEPQRTMAQLHDPDRRLRLIACRASVEDIIRGMYADSIITFYYFSDALEGVKGRYYWFGAGERWIVFLRREGERIRTLTDDPGVDLMVRSGAHPQQEIPIDGGVAKALAYILLTPGRAFNKSYPEFFAMDFSRMYAEPVSTRYLSSRLDLLRANAEPSLRDAACLEAADFFGVDENCLSGTEMNSVPAAVFERFKQRVARTNAIIPDELKRDPLRDHQYANLDDVFVQLELYARYGSAHLKASACDALSRCGRRFSLCSER